MHTPTEPGSPTEPAEMDGWATSLYSTELRERFAGFAVRNDGLGNAHATVDAVRALVTIKATKTCDLSDSLATHRQLSISAVAVNGAFAFANVPLAIKLPTCVVLDHASAETYFRTLIPQLTVVVPYAWDGTELLTVKVADDVMT